MCNPKSEIRNLKSEVAKIAFIGQEQILRVFNYFGTSVFLVSTPQEADEKLQELVNDEKGDWGVVYIEENLAESIKNHIAELNKRPLPAISIFPSSGEKQDIAKNMLRSLIRKVTGVEMRLE